MTLLGNQSGYQTSGDCAVWSKFVVVLIVMFLFACSPVSHAIAASADEAAYAEGLQAVRTGDNGKAINLFSRAIQLNPNDFRYYNDRGIAYKASGDRDKALEDYTKALTMKPGYANALNNRGLLFVQMGQFDKAEEDFRNALKSGGFEAKIHTNLGMALAGKGDHEAAVKEFQSAMTFRPMDPRAFFLMGQSLEKLGKGDQALKMYQVAMGMVKDPAAEEQIEKRISALEKDVPQASASPRGNTPPEAAAKPAAGPSRDIAKQVAHAAQASQRMQPVQTAKVTKAQREIVRARPMAVAPVTANEVRPAASEPLPSSLEDLDRSSRTRALAKFSPSAAEIFRQGVQFMEQDDTKMALIRFEDTLQLERRNKNAVAVAWSTLQAGRAYLKIGDRIKASTNIEAAFRMFQRLRMPDGMILSLVDMAAIRKQSGQKEQASKLLAEAVREATSMNNQEVASVLRDMVAGRTPTAKQRTASSTAPAQKEGKPVAAPAEAPTPVARLELVKRGDAPPKGSPEVKKTRQPAVPKEQNSPVSVASAEPKKAEPVPAGKPRGPVTWGKPKTETSVASTPPVAQQRVAEQPVQRKSEPAATAPDKIPPRPKQIGASKPVKVETGVGGTPAAVFPAPIPPTTQQHKQAPEKEKEIRSAETRPQPAPAPADPIISQLVDGQHRVTKEERREAATKRISGDLSELKRLNAASDETGMIVVLERLARRYVLRRQYDKALHGLTASLALREKLHLDGPSAQLFDDRGTIRQKVGNQVGALEDFTRAFVLAETRRESSINIEALQTRCRELARQLGLDPTAAMNAYRALWTARARTDGRGETDALHSIGTLYDKAQKSSEALNYYERAAASVLTDKARVYGKLGKQKLAEQSYKEALEAFKRLDYSRYLAVQKESGLDAAPSARSRR